MIYEILLFYIQKHHVSNKIRFQIFYHLIILGQNVKTVPVQTGSGIENAQRIG